jgi:hypothetical protein
MKADSLKRGHEMKLLACGLDDVPGDMAPVEIDGADDRGIQYFVIKYQMELIDGYIEMTQTGTTKGPDA